MCYKRFYNKRSKPAEKRNHWEKEVQIPSLSSQSILASGIYDKWKRRALRLVQLRIWIFKASIVEVQKDFAGFT